mgnify:CR=1 FL=1
MSTNLGKAIEKSVYYTNTNNFNPVISFMYSDEESFNDIIQNLSNNIEVKVIFGNKEDLSYSIFKQISYTDLLLDKTTSFYIVNRVNASICFYKEVESKTEKIAVLNYDSILAELFLSSELETVKNSKREKRSYFYPALLGISCLLFLPIPILKYLDKIDLEYIS